MVLTSEEREFVKKLFEKHKPKRMTYLEVERLYEFFLSRCKELEIDPKAIDFEYLIDWDLSYWENHARIESELIGLIPVPVEIEELEFWKKRVEELEKRIEELEKVVPIEEMERLRGEVKKWKERYEKVKKTIEKVKITPGLTEEDVVRIVRESLKEFGRALAPVLKALLERIKALEERPPEFIEARIVLPEIPPREFLTQKKIDVLTKEEYVEDVDFVFRVRKLGEIVGYRFSDIFFTVSDETRKTLGYPTFLDLAKSFYKEGLKIGKVSPAHLRALGFTDEEMRKIMDD